MCQCSPIKINYTFPIKQTVTFIPFFANLFANLTDDTAGVLEVDIHVLKYISK
jgi:hypothetical protein